ncbi:helix-turn-helix domain-containing protein [Pelosinus propionicus]|uniref:DNA binding domain-containing protein, excisionase family n=1 Tax=Pelosinus propionicus DSM 13327 TaxID=1123291 RepID=A0A1I4JG97_9FIRM|nr:helix-turn-helix domain-containing protein [Pelosinus propionicus]SFL65580.1 DNA binding domain-containing protein, excisionase family [Pelosinus propionicus DSM 13327]
MAETAFYTPLETAAYLGVPVSQVYALVKTKGFPVKRIGRHYRINIKSLQQWSTDFSEGI